MKENKSVWIKFCIIIVCFMTFLCIDKVMVSAEIISLDSAPAGTWAYMGDFGGYKIGPNKFLITEEVYPGQFDQDGTNTFSLTDPNNIGYYINSYSYMNSINDIIVQGTFNVGNEKNEGASTVTAKLGLLTKSEWEALTAEGGPFDDGRIFWLATKDSSSSNKNWIVRSDGTTSTLNSNSTMPVIMPVFYYKTGLYVNTDTGEVYNYKPATCDGLVCPNLVDGNTFNIYTNNLVAGDYGIKKVNFEVFSLYGWEHFLDDGGYYIYQGTYIGPGKYKVTVNTSDISGMRGPYIVYCYVVNNNDDWEMVYNARRGYKDETGGSPWLNSLDGDELPFTSIDAPTIVTGDFNVKINGLHDNSGVKAAYAIVDWKSGSYDFVKNGDTWETTIPASSAYRGIGYYTISILAESNDNFGCLLGEKQVWYDPTPVSDNFKIENGADYTNTKNVTLNIGKNDGEMSEIMVSNSPTLEGAVWEPYVPNKPWILNDSDTPNGNGITSVYFKYKNSLGIEKPIVRASIYYDIIAPTGSIEINNGQEYANSSPLNLKLSANDNGCDSSKLKMYISNITTAPTKNSAGWENYSDIKTYTYTGGEGTVSLYAWFMDPAGNISNRYEDDIIYGAQITITISPDSGSVIGGTNINFSASSPNGIAKLYYRWDSAVEDADHPTIIINADSAEVPIPMEIGTHHLYVNAEDNAGKKLDSAEIHEYNTSSIVANNRNKYLTMIKHNQIVWDGTDNLVVSSPGIEDYYTFRDGNELTYRLEYNVLDAYKINDIKIALDLNVLNEKDIEFTLSQVNLLKQQADGTFTIIKPLTFNKDGRMNRYTIQINDTSITKNNGNGIYAIEYTGSLNIKRNSSETTNFIIRNEANIFVNAINNSNWEIVDPYLPNNKNYIETKISR